MGRLVIRQRLKGDLPLSSSLGFQSKARCPAANYESARLQLVYSSFGSLAARVQAILCLTQAVGDRTIIMPVKTEMHINENRTCISRERSILLASQHIVWEPNKLPCLSLVGLYRALRSSHRQRASQLL